MKKWIHIGLIIGALLSSTGCLEQELQPYTVSQAQLLLSGPNIIAPKLWQNDQLGATMVLRRSQTPFSYLVRSASNDTLAYGTWRLSQSIRGEFTDTLFLINLRTAQQTIFQEFAVVLDLTSLQLTIDNQGNRMDWKYEEAR